LIRLFGDKGKEIRFAEAFELSPYGRPVSTDEFQAMLQP